MSALLLVRDRRVLMVRARARDVLYLPGGKAEPHETDVQAAVREAYEETGLRLTALLEDLTSSTTATSAELGLPTAVTARPTSEAQVIEILAKNDGGRWVKVYMGRTSGAARSFASDLRNGKKVRINRIGRFDARVVQENVVEARRIVEKASA